MERADRYVLGTVFLTLGLTFFWLGARESGWLQGAALSAGLCFSLLAGACLLAMPGFLGKRRDGRLLPTSYILYWPYFVSNYVLLGLSRWVVRERPFDKVAPGLWVGSRLFPFDRAETEACGFRSVLDLTCEFSEAVFLRRLPAYFCIPLLDRGTPTQAQLRAGVEFIGQGLESGPVYVHCAQGHGRSATFAAAWMLAAGRAGSPDHAVEILKASRPLVKLTAGQFAALAQFGTNVGTKGSHAGRDIRCGE